MRPAYRPRRTARASPTRRPKRAQYLENEHGRFTGEAGDGNGCEHTNEGTTDAASAVGGILVLYAGAAAQAAGRRPSDSASHWAYRPLTRPAPPPVKNPAWLRNPLDAFIAARHEAKGLTPAPEASRRVLIRRLSLDLTGLPPTSEEVDAFLADRSPDA